jgi:hypothetical protein
LCHTPQQKKKKSRRKYIERRKKTTTNCKLRFANCALGAVFCRPQIIHFEILCDTLDRSQGSVSLPDEKKTYHSVRCFGQGCLQRRQAGELFCPRHRALGEKRLAADVACWRDDGDIVQAYIAIVNLHHLWKEKTHMKKTQTKKNRTGCPKHSRIRKACEKNVSVAAQNANVGAGMLA